MQVLIAGGTGTLGSTLARLVADEGHTVTQLSRTTPPGRPVGEWQALDIRDRDAVLRSVTAIQPDTIVNCAFDAADWSTTALGAVHLAESAQRSATRLVHISSDAVFASRPEPYSESDSPCPTTPYGAAKAAAEVGVMAVCPHAAVIRTSLIIGDGDTRRERQVHQAVATPEDHVFFTDNIRCPVSVHDLAAAVWEMALNGAEGVRHAAGSQAISRYELATRIAARDRLDPTQLRSGCGVPGGASTIILDSSATQATLHTTLRGARDFLPQLPDRV